MIDALVLNSSSSDPLHPLEALSTRADVLHQDRHPRLLPAGGPGPAVLPGQRRLRPDHQLRPAVSHLSPRHCQQWVGPSAFASASCIHSPLRRGKKSWCSCQVCPDLTLSALSGHRRPLHSVLPERRQQSVVRIWWPKCDRGVGVLRPERGSLCALLQVSFLQPFSCRTVGFF